MRIDGKAIAEEIFNELRQRVKDLGTKGITPKLVIILVGDDPASASYVKQKEIKAKVVGIETQTQHFPSNITEQELLSTIQQFNNSSNVHGLIVQRPLPQHIDENVIDQAVVAEKDVDGFREDSLFLPPLGIAVFRILEEIPDFRTKKIVLLGKGKTGGRPTIQVLNRRGVPFTVVDSKTPDPDSILKNADIVISAVGKLNIITKDKIKQGAILIGVGMFKGKDGKLHGDYEEEDIKDTALQHTPIPGGVGPVNVAMLLENVVTAAGNQINE